MQFVRNMLTPARVTTAIGVLTAAAAFITALSTNFAPGSSVGEALAKAGVAIGSLIAAAATLYKFLEGQQNWESIVHTGVPKGSPVTVVNQGASTTESHMYPLVTDDEADAAMNQPGNLSTADRTAGFGDPDEPEDDTDEDQAPGHPGEADMGREPRDMPLRPQGD